MALDLKLYIELDLESGEEVRISDITGAYTTENTGGYGSPNPTMGSVNKTRFIFSTYQTEQNASEVTSLELGYEYEVQGTGTVSVDGKTYSPGDTFIPMVDVTPTIPAGITIVSTGRFAQNSTFLPSDQSKDFVPSEFGIDELVFSDSPATVTYEVYTTEYANTTAPAGTYIVKGTANQSITVGRVTYWVGEVFTQVGSFTVSGTGSIVKFNASVTVPFVLYYNAWSYKTNVEQEYVSGCGCVDCFGTKLLKLNAILEAVKENYSNEFNNSASKTQCLLDEAATIYYNECNQ